MDEQIIKNITSFIDHKGFRIERLAKKMGISTSSFYANLQGRRKKSIYEFATKLAVILGYESTYFMDEKFQLPKEYEAQYGLSGSIAFSYGKLSPSGQEGLNQIGKICELIEIYCD